MRYVMIRSEDGTERMAHETPLPAEKNLHDVLTDHPELLPADDLELIDPVVVGRETKLESGYADLVLVDQTGQICLVEVKKEGNPDTRRVVAQLLDYAAALWQLTLEEFERVVVAPYLETAGSEADTPLTMDEYVRSRAATTSGESLEEDGVTNGIEQSLSTGRFRLVVAAPVIPQGVEKVVEYLNAQGHLIYGLEVSFFSGAAECFVPRLVVKPRVSEIRSSTGKAPALTQADFLQSLPAHVQPGVQAFLDEAPGTGAHLGWRSYGPALRPSRSPARVVVYAEKARVGIIVLPPKGFPSEPFDVARAETVALGIGTVSVDQREHSVRFDSVTEEQLRSYLHIALKLLRALTPSVEFVALDQPIPAEFMRNDNIIWAKSVPPVAHYIGRWLRGTLELSPGPELPVSLEPLKANQPGWLPRFETADAQGKLWPTNDYSGTYRLSVRGVGE